MAPQGRRRERGCCGTWGLGGEARHGGPVPLRVLLRFLSQVPMLLRLRLRHQVLGKRAGQAGGRCGGRAGGCGGLVTFLSQLFFLERKYLHAGGGIKL